MIITRKRINEPFAVKSEKDCWAINVITRFFTSQHEDQVYDDDDDENDDNFDDDGWDDNNDDDDMGYGSDHC